MAAEISATNWKNVEVGRVVLLQEGPYAGRLATIVEIIDHKRALIDGPSSDASLAVPRQAFSFSNLLLSAFVIDKLPRGARSGAVKAAWEKAGIDEKWRESNWAKKRAQQVRRKALTDFERFKVMRLKKQRRFEERKALAKVKASA
jgi:large subunit ribosomal protein L14e